MMPRYVIEPADDSGVIHSIIGGRSMMGSPGRWKGYCGTLVAGFVLPHDEVEGVRCSKCAARAVRFGANL